MNTGLYRKIAAGNIRKNYRFFIPRIMAETGLLACFYIVFTLTMDDRMSNVYGGNYIPTFMIIGTIVMAILSVILLAYTNSFLMKQRRQEFGLYNVLGMEKRHIGRVLFHEGFICSLISVVLGLVLGMLFYKICSMFICFLLKSDIIVGFYFLTPKTIVPSALFYIFIDLMIYFTNRIGITRISAVELLRSRSTGEKEPKIKWLMLIIGVLTLGAGYYLAVSVQSPLEAIFMFFAAIILVIIGTYFLFVTGSIFVLKLLKKKKKYYYTKKHFPAVSGLLYRMKQNAVGLASIAILATGVIVMISSTVSLYSGMQETLDSHYPQQLYLTGQYETDKGELKDIPVEELQSIVKKASADNDLEIEETITQDFIRVSFAYQNGRLFSTAEEDELGPDFEYGDIGEFSFIDAALYNELTGNSVELSENEILICRVTSAIESKTISLGKLQMGDMMFDAVEYIAYFPIKAQGMLSAFNNYGIVVSDKDVLNEIFEFQKEKYGQYASKYSHQLAVKYTDTNEYLEKGNKLQDELFDGMREYVEKDIDPTSFVSAYVDSLWDARYAVLGMYGTLLFLGIILGLVFLFATALIIYYKQISEGYEDRNRFQIMKKVGMSDAEVKQTIRSQVLLIFFLPIIVAGIHMCFASPILYKLLKLLMLPSLKLYIICAVTTYVLFAVVYVIIYLLTARTYYKIVQ